MKKSFLSTSALPPTDSTRRWLHWGCATLVCLGLVACGGGSGDTLSSNSNTSSSTLTTTTASSALSTATGTVTGFGSVYVDGTHIEDAYARVVHENADGSLSNAELSMGQRVSARLESSGHASTITIDAAVIGTVSAVSTSAATLTVAGQQVSINTDSASGPVTVFGGGYTSLSSVLVGDLVSVHGTPSYNTTTQRYQVVATRVAKDPGLARIQLSGKIAGLSTSGTASSFTLNGLPVSVTASTLIRPSGSTLSNGLQITAYGSTLSAGTLSAGHIRVDKNQSSASVATSAHLSGLVSAYDSTAGTFSLSGTLVKVGSATITPTGSTLKNAAYVVVKGSVNSDGSLTATQIQVRTQDASSALAAVNLIGPITNFVNAQSFVVRGIPVDASAVDAASACAGVTLANDVVVQIRAQQQSGTNVVKATALQCRPSLSTQLITHVRGTVASASTSSFVLTTKAGTSQTITWNSNTTFVGLSSAELAGKVVRVDGYTSGTTYVARVVRLEGSSNRSDNDSFTESEHQDAWDNYRKSHH